MTGHQNLRTQQAQSNIRPFHLKLFSLFHHNSAMKVGTDSLVLGSWVEPGTSRNILDIGCGCGILALMMASKSTAVVDGVELDPNSAEEARMNFFQSPYHHRLKVVQADFNSFVKTTGNRYDLIISNPPFFTEDKHSASPQKLTARHAVSLDYKQLVAGSIKLLRPNGKFKLVLPYAESAEFLKIAAAEGLFPETKVLIFPFRGHSPNRVNLSMTFHDYPNTRTEYFNIREEDGSFTQEYKTSMKQTLIGIK